jgi:ribosomal protein L22
MPKANDDYEKNLMTDEECGLVIKAKYIGDGDIATSVRLNKVSVNFVLSVLQNVIDNIAEETINDIDPSEIN